VRDGRHDKCGVQAQRRRGESRRPGSNHLELTPRPVRSVLYITMSKESPSTPSWLPRTLFFPNAP
jgi:hypothetical protein